MARKSRRYREQAQSLSAEEAPLVLLEMRHALLAEPVRLVNDTQDLFSRGNNYSRAAFAWVPPDDKDRQTPRAQLRMSNLGSDIGDFFERTNGGKGTTFKVLQVMRSAPDLIEDDLIVDVSDVEVSTAEVTGQLGYDDVLNKVGTAYTYRPETAPGDLLMHWSDGYVGIPHDQLDCAELVEKVLREQFSRRISFPRKKRPDLFHRAALITSHCADFATRIEVPVDGCGVLMFARGRMAYMGLYCAVDQGYVLHSDSAFGESVCVPLTRVAADYRIEGFYAWLD